MKKPKRIMIVDPKESAFSINVEDDDPRGLYYSAPQMDAYLEHFRNQIIDDCIKMYAIPNSLQTNL